jgi:hypothetical protein
LFHRNSRQTRAHRQLAGGKSRAARRAARLGIECAQAKSLVADTIDVWRLRVHILPTSSAVITRIFGFACSCAWAGETSDKGSPDATSALAAIMAAAISVSHMIGSYSGSSIFRWSLDLKASPSLHRDGDEGKFGAIAQARCFSVGIS